MCLISTTTVFAQGTFTYTFSGDNSPLNVAATFQASDSAVASGLLTSANTTGGSLSQGGNLWSLYYLNFAVNTATGAPIGPADSTQLTAFHGLDEIDIYGGIAGEPYTEVVYWPWVGNPSTYSRTSGTWSMTYVPIPEPSAAALAVLGLGALILRRVLTGTRGK
jgi:hypothetical protein